MASNLASRRAPLLLSPGACGAKMSLMPRTKTDDEVPGPRHSPQWYDQSGEFLVLRPGDRMFIPCRGGPCRSRLETFPPRLEIPEHSGTYVLIDVGRRHDWHYAFVPHDHS